jgi:murein DD-endopeptidase MepM/ murein hydrolase activator NlpD
MKGFKFVRRIVKPQDTTKAESGADIQQNHNFDQAADHFHQEKGTRRFRRSWILGSVGLVLLATVLIGAEKKKEYVAANTVTYYQVLVKGTEIGKINDQMQLNQLYDQKQKEYQEKYPDSTMVLQTEGITIEQQQAYKPEIDSEATLHKLEGMLKAYAVGVQLLVDGKVVGIVKDQETANAVLEGVKNHYIPQTQVATASKLTRTAATSSTTKSKAPDKVESVKISEEVTIVPIKADPNKVLDVQKAVKALTEGKEAPLLYTVQEGDTISGIAKRYEITQKEVYSNNPDVKELTLKVGDTLKLKVPQPDLTVVTVEQVMEQVVTEPEVIVRKSDQLAAGKSKVVRPGQTGLKEMQYRLTKKNGMVVQEEWLGQTVIKASLPEVVYRGTKVVGEGTGMFSWPVSGATLTSSFGERWSRAHKGVDLVSGNRNIKAADAGTVIFAGVQSGYGNVVIVDHRNGYQTYYGHLNSISVSSGQRLEQGGKIGVMGNTGRSTGTHLHFEIRKNGTAVNPLRYLK